MGNCCRSGNSSHNMYEPMEDGNPQTDRMGNCCGSGHSSHDKYEKMKDGNTQTDRMGNCCRTGNSSHDKYEQMEDMNTGIDRMGNCCQSGNFTDDRYEQMEDGNPQTNRFGISNCFGTWYSFCNDGREEHQQKERVDPEQYRISHDELKRKLDEQEKELATLRSNCSELRTRLSEIASMQLTEGNPNIVDLSNPNRPDKLAEQFSELYDNQWTDCYQDLVNVFKRNEEESIHILLQIVQTSYNICLDRSHNIVTAAKDSMFAFAGRSDGEPDKALDALIQETLHKLKSHRTKNFKAPPTKMEEEIKAKLISMIGESEISVCGDFIEECIRICWLMCINDPPMYMFCDKEALFDKYRYVAYTKMGHSVSYVVWPVLYLQKNGPMMRKGVAQGEDEDKDDNKGNSKVNPASPSLLIVDHMQEKQTYNKDTPKLDSDYQIKEPYIAKENKSENRASDDSNLFFNKIQVTVDQNKGKSEQLGNGDHTKSEPTEEDEAMRPQHSEAMIKEHNKGQIITAMIENETRCTGNYNDVEQFKGDAEYRAATTTFYRAEKTGENRHGLNTPNIEINGTCWQDQSKLNEIEDFSAICHTRRVDSEFLISHESYKPENNATDVPKYEDNVKYHIDSASNDAARSTEENHGSTTVFVQVTSACAEDMVIASVTKQNTEREMQHTFPIIIHSVTEQTRFVASENEAASNDAKKVRPEKNEGNNDIKESQVHVVLDDEVSEDNS